MKNKIQDIVPLEITNITVPDVLEESKLQGIKQIGGNVVHRQSIPVISVISGNIDDEVRRDNYLQGTYCSRKNIFKHFGNN